MQSLWLPAIQAQLALDKKNPASALNIQQAGSPSELGQIAFVPNISCLYHVYVRGEAYLAAGQGNAAAAEFQKSLDHSGIVWNCWTGALAHLGVARANALQARTSQGADADAARVRALAAYKDFLTLWKDADSDIPILKEAKAGYAKLQFLKLLWNSFPRHRMSRVLLSVSEIRQTITAQTSLLRWVLCVREGVDSGTASTRDSWRIMWRVLSARRKCRTGDSGTRPWASVYEILVHETSVFQAARGSDGVRVTPTREIEAPM